MDSTRRTLLTTGAAAAVAAAPRAFAQNQAAKGFYEKGDVRIHYEEAGSGFPLLIIPGGGQNSTISWIAQRAPFNAIEEFKNEYRCITADLRNANGGQSSGPLEIDRPWDSYADFVFSVTRDFVRAYQTPVLVMPDDTPSHPYDVAMESTMLAPKSEMSLYPWKEPKERIPVAVRHVRTFLRAHRPI
jgi:hypothetical protein